MYQLDSWKSRAGTNRALTAPACVQLWERFRAGQKPPESLGPSRDFNVDMVPKFIMANGNLVKVRQR